MTIPENDTQLWKGFNGHGLYAQRTERDRDGNVIDETYAKKADLHALSDSLSDSTTTEITPHAAKTAIDGILKVPTPGAEGTMLSYGVSQNSMAWDAWESDVFDVPSELLFLTYFNQFNNKTKVDTPLVGEPYSMGTKQIFTPTTLSISGTQSPAIYDYVKSQGRGSTSCVNGTIPENAEFISAELWLYSSGTRYDFGSGLSLGVAPWITLDPLFTSNDFPLSGPNLSSCDSYELYNGSSVNQYYSPGYLRYGVNIRQKTVHLAVVDDLVKKDSYHYVNGDLMYVLHGTRQSNVYRYELAQGNTGKQFTVTGVAIFAGDLRINNGMNYPVPEKPYMNWSANG